MRLPIVLSLSVQHSSSVATQWIVPSAVPCHSACWSSLRLQRRIGVIDLAVGPLVVVGRVDQILVQRLAVDRQALAARLGDGGDAGAGGHVHHVERGAGHVLGEPQDAAEAQVLGQLIVHLGEVLEADAALADQLGVHVHDDVVVFGMDDAEPALLGQHLERLPDVAEIDHAAGARRQDVGGEDLERRIAGLDRLGELAGEFGRRLGMQHDVIGPVARAFSDEILVARLDRLLRRARRRANRRSR